MIDFIPIIIGFILGYLYYEHIWLQVSKIANVKQQRWFYGFWIRYGMLSIATFIMTLFGFRSTFMALSGLLLSRPVYFMIHRKRIFLRRI